MLTFMVPCDTIIFMTKDEIQDFYRKLGGRIRQCREQADHSMTQEELGRRVNLSRTSIVNIEKGRQHLAVHQIYLFADALKVGPNDLLPTMLQDDSWVAEKLSANVDKEIVEWATKLG